MAPTSHFPRRPVVRRAPVGGGRLVAASLLAAFVVATAAATRVVGWPRMAVASPVIPLPVPAFSASEEEQLDRDIALYSARAERDPGSAADRAALADLHLRRARILGSDVELQRSEAAARASLAIRTSHNGRARQILASALLAQHRFAEAKGVAHALVLDQPDVPAFRALLGECQLEVGDYAGADTIFPTLREWVTRLDVAPRVARWHELSGRTEDARRRLTLARDAAREAAYGLSREQRAWFELRVGDFELRHGRLDAADSALQAALIANPGDHRVLGAMARLAAARGDSRRAIELGERAIARSSDPVTLALLGDAYRLVADSSRGAEYDRATEALAIQEPYGLHRAGSLWLLDHGRQVDWVTTRAHAELAVRPDVYGLDLYAWALHTQRRDEEARAVMTRALARGVEDAQLYVHAAMIERALGDEEAAADHLARARSIDPLVREGQAARVP